MTVRITLPVLLSVIAGYVDTAGFLALQGLFTAHVTGNFVTFGAAIVLGAGGAIPKLLALPVFCMIVLLTRLLSAALTSRALPALRVLLVLQMLLLVLGAVLAIRLGPFVYGDSLAALATGMVLVSAMAIQNAGHRIHLASAAPSTLMTGTTTQVMIDIADMIWSAPKEARVATRARLLRMSASVVGFAMGCAVAAIFYDFATVWCFVIPPVLVLAALLLPPDDKMAS
jgi:uncharacterized membrane protein YoaK (UPF0700 family)